MISCQLAHLLIDVEMGEELVIPAGPSKTLENQSLFSQDASRKRRSAVHLPFHHSQPFTAVFFLQRRYFKPRVERRQRAPLPVPSSLCVPMRQMLISGPGRAVVVSADLCC